MSRSSQPHSVSVTAGDVGCPGHLRDSAVLDGISVYLGSWWTVTPAQQARAVMHDRPHRVVEFARKPVQVVGEHGEVHAVDVEEEVA